MTPPHPTDHICSLLQNLGYKAETIEDDEVASAASGLRFYIHSYKASVQFRCLIIMEDGDREEFIKLSNEYNSEMRFVKSYIDKDKDLAIEADWWLNIDDANHVEHFQKCMDFWEVALSTLKQHLRDFATTKSGSLAESGQDTP